MPLIHPTAIIDPAARLAEGVSVGAFSVIGPDVELGEGVSVSSHVVIGGRTSIGSGTRIFPFASIGLAPQDLKYKGEPSRLEIGRDCLVREHVTVNIGTEGGGMLTSVGDQVMLAVGCHVAHDCRIGRGVLVMNHVLLGGHVEIDDFAVIGGGAAVHQFVRIGCHAMVGGLSGVEGDIIPYGTVMGNRARLEGLNLVGLKRRGFGRADIHSLRSAFKILFQVGDSTGVLSERIEDVRSRWPDCEPVQVVVRFLDTDSSRSFCRPMDHG